MTEYEKMIAGQWYNANDAELTQMRAQKRAGGFLNALFCDVFVMESSKIKQLTSYLTEIKK